MEAKVDLRRLYVFIKDQEGSRGLHHMINFGQFLVTNFLTKVSAFAYKVIVTWKYIRSIIHLLQLN